MSFWHRVEPNTVDENIEEGVQARVADPLWMLARQWQFGEFKGEDAASPVHARLWAHSSRMATFRNEATPKAPVESLPVDRPLECRVEAEEVVDHAAAVGLAAEAGLQFLRRLESAGLGDVRRRTTWRERFGFLAAELPPTGPLPAPAQRRIDLIVRRGVDGRRLSAADRATIEALVEPGVAAAVGNVFEVWLQEYRIRVREPEGSGDCWADENLEYRFSVGVPGPTAEVVLAADRYAGGHLDWEAFRIAPELSHGLGPEKPEVTQRELLPTPVTFTGQPAPRWWTFEDRRVYLGNLSAGPSDIARLVVAEFGAVFSDDWFIVPVTVDVGSLNRVERIELIDVFGGTTRIDATAVNDYRQHGASRPFKLYELQDDPSAAMGVTPWMLVAPALADAQHGRPVERVTMVRDEGANLAWAIEQQVELPTGEAMHRRQQWSRPAEPPSASADAWRYRLQSPVPPWWIPLVPQRQPQDPAVRLRRGRMQSWDELDAGIAGPKGRFRRG